MYKLRRKEGFALARMAHLCCKRIKAHCTSELQGAAAKSTKFYKHVILIRG